MKILLVDQIAKVNYKYSYSLAEAIKNKGNQVTLIIDQKKEDENCTCNKFNFFNTDEKNIGKIKKMLNYIQSYIRIFRETKKGKYDVLHTQWLIFSPVDYFFLKIIKSVTHIKLVVTIHDILPFNEKFYDFYFHKKVYGLAEHVIVQADNNVKRFRELFPKLSGKEVMIPHGHFLEYGTVMDKIKAREYLKLPQNKIILLFFGQIKKVKGVGILLEAFSKIYKNNPNVCLLIAGSVWKDDFSQYQKIIDENDMKSVVRTDIKYIPDEEVKYYYSAADCCVLPYLDVYQSGVVQLTYAYRKPAIATNIGAFREVILKDETGFMCEANSVESLSRAIEEALLRKEEFSEMGQKGYKYIERKFSWEKIADEVCSLYCN